MTLVNVGLAERSDAVEQHAPGIGENHAGLEPLRKIVRRRDLVVAVFLEEVWPCLDFAAVDATDIGVLNVVDETGDVVHAFRSSKSHLRAIGLPEAAYRGLRHAAFAGVRAGAAHFDHRLLAGGTRDPALHEAADAAVFH